MVKALCSIFLGIVLTGIAGIASPSDKTVPNPQLRYLNSYLQTSESGNFTPEALETIDREYEILLKHFIKRQGKIKDESVFIKMIFSKVQLAFLHNYEQYAGFNDILTSYTFDCATATALYASFFVDLGIEFEIWETNYHSYIKISTKENTVLLESTDPVNGFNMGEEAKELERRYIADNLEGCLYENGINIHRKTTPEEFIGLLHFNQAVKSYNEGDYLKAMGQIQQAEIKYPSDRIFLMKKMITDRVVLVSTSSL